MTERERLYELIVDTENKFYSETPCGTDTARIEKTVEHLIENGVILPPCKIGDEVYRVIKRCGEWQILPCIVKGITYRGGEWWDIVVVGHDSMLGSTVFLTREEAESALERIEEVEKPLI